MCVSQYLILKIFFWDLDGVVLDSVSVPLVGNLLGHQLFEDEEQQLVVVSAEGQIAGERLSRQKILDEVSKHNQEESHTLHTRSIDTSSC